VGVRNLSTTPNQFRNAFRVVGLGSNPLLCATLQAVALSVEMPRLGAHFEPPVSGKWRCSHWAGATSSCGLTPGADPVDAACNCTFTPLPPARWMEAP